MMPEPFRNSRTIRLSYSGPAVADGLMDVSELGPALAAIGDLCQQANRVLNGDRAVVEVQARAEFSRGSFGFDLDVAQSILAHADTLFRGDQVRDVAYLLALLGFTDTDAFVRVGTSLLKFLRWLLGRTITQQRVDENGTVHITAGDHSHIEVHQHVVQLADNPSVRRALDGIVGPLRRPGMERLEVKDKQLHDRVIETITTADVPALSVPSPSQEAIELPDEDREAAVEIVKVAFQEGMSWELSEGTGGSHFPAVMKDPEFFAQVQNRSVSFAKGDTLRVRLQTKKFMTSTGLRSEVRITKVLQHIPAPRQGVLFPPDGPRGPSRPPRRGKRNPVTGKRKRIRRQKN